MNLNEAIAKIHLVMGNRSDLAVKATAALQAAQDQMEKGPLYPWFLISEDATIRTEIGESRLPLPADFISEFEDGFMYYRPDDTALPERKLRKFEYEYLKALYPRTNATVPVGYARAGDYFHLFPVPDGLYEIVMKYYRKAVPISSLSGTQTNKWLTYAPDTIIGKAGQELAVGYRDWGAEGKFKVMEMEGRQVMTIQDTEQEASNTEWIMGGAAY